jgi:hypothetical protein
MWTTRVDEENQIARKAQLIFNLIAYSHREFLVEKVKSKSWRHKRFFFCGWSFLKKAPSKTIFINFITLKFSFSCCFLNLCIKYLGYKSHSFSTKPENKLSSSAQHLEMTDREIMKASWLLGKENLAKFN